MDYLPYRRTKRSVNYFYTTLISNDSALYAIFHAKFCNFWHGWYRYIYLLFTFCPLDSLSDPYAFHIRASQAGPCTPV